MEEETVNPQEEQQIAEQVVESLQQEVAEEPIQKEYEEKQVPLSALQKERKKRQELEMQIEFERNQRTQIRHEEPKEDDSKYESATKEDLSRAQQEAIRIVEEKMWVKNNPEKYERLNELLPQFLKQRPNLAYAINSASNRYEEAYILMDALTPKQQQQLKVASVPKKEAPGSPTSVPKSAAINQTIDVMQMSDDEFSKWRQSQRKRR